MGTSKKYNKRHGRMCENVYTWRGEFAIYGLRHLLPKSITYYSRSSRGELELRAIITPRTYSNPMSYIKNVQYLDWNGFLRISVALEVHRRLMCLSYLKNVTRTDQIHEVTVLRESDLRRKEKWMLNNEKNINLHAFVYMCFSVCLNRTWEQRFRFWLYQYCPLLIHVSLSLPTHTINRKQRLYSFRLSILIQISNHIILAQLLWWTSNNRERWITDKEQWLSTLVLTLSKCIY